MTALAEILHNIKDHTETLFRVANEPALDPDLRERLSSHILLEEKENTARLLELQKEDSLPLIAKLIDHSYFLQRIIEDKSVPSDLTVELLDHFMEEHLEWQQELQQSQPLPESQIHAWTVGPLWPQGGR